VLRTRLLTAAIALPTVLAAIFFLPSAGFRIFIAIVGGWGLYETYEMAHPVSALPILVMILLGVLPLIWLLVGSYPPPYPAPSRAFVILVVVLTVAIINILTVGVAGATSMSKGLWTVVSGALYVGPLFPFFALVRNSPNGIAMLVLMLLLVIAADTGAYFTGRAIGRHKLAFKVSPGKTIEGAVGGILASIGAGLILRPWTAPTWGIEKMIVFAGLVAILAIIGDLANSAFKRVAGVKDSGWIFPGHGGLLDRTCSLVFAAVLTYYYMA